MKKLFASLLALAMLLTLVSGCAKTTPDAPSQDQSNTSDNSSDPASPPEEKQKLTLVLRGGVYPEYMAPLLKQFEEENHVTCEVLSFSFDDLYSKITLDAANAEGAYDLMMVDSQWFAEFSEYGLMTDLTEAGYQRDPDFVDALCPKIGSTGHEFVVPYCVQINFLFYNDAILNAAGAQVPQTWEEVLKIAQDVSASGTNGYLLRAQAGDSIMGDFLPILWAHGGDVFDAEGNVTIDTPEFKKALEFYIALGKTGAIMEKDDIVAAVNDGNAAMSLCWATWYQPNESSSAHYTVIPSKLNAGSAGDHASSIFGSWYLGIPSNSKNQDLALKLLEYLTSSEAQYAAIEADCDPTYVPTRTSVYEDAGVIEKYPFLGDVYEAIPNGTYRPMVRQWTQIIVDLGTEIESAVHGMKSVDQAAADGQAVVEQLMAS